MSLPVCIRCKRISVLSPCRNCATVEELKKYPDAPSDAREVTA